MRSGSAAHCVSSGGSAIRRRPTIAHTSLHGSDPSPAMLKTPGTSFKRREHERAGDVVLVGELQAGVEPEHLGHERQPQRLGERRGRRRRRARW